MPTLSQVMKGRDGIPGKGTSVCTGRVHWCAQVIGHPELTWFMSADVFPTEVPTCAEKLGPRSRGGFPPGRAVALLMDWREPQPCGAQRKVTCGGDVYQEA